MANYKAAGRPLLKGARKKPVTVMLRPKVHALVWSQSKAEQMSVSQWIATRIDEHFLSEAREKVG